jgi:hypothetical protein
VIQLQAGILSQYVPSRQRKVHWSIHQKALDYFIFNVFPAYKYFQIFHELKLDHQLPYEQQQLNATKKFIMLTKTKDKKNDHNQFVCFKMEKVLELLVE